MRLVNRSIALVRNNIFEDSKIALLPALLYRWVEEPSGSFEINSYPGQAIMKEAYLS
jgi:hypothetical protein